jgi:hypothetical protein
MEEKEKEKVGKRKKKKKKGCKKVMKNNQIKSNR